MAEPIFFENVLIKFLFKDEEIRGKALPFLVLEVFEDQLNAKLMKSILEMNNKYEKFPTVPELRIELEDEKVYKRLLEIIEMDISEYQSEFLLEEVEEFIRKKLIHNVNVDIVMNLNNNKSEELQKTPDQLREALSFSFDTKIGLDFLEDEDRLYNFLHNKDKVVPSHLTELDKIIEGGFHEKSLTLFLSECVDENTLVKIRFKKKFGFPYCVEKNVKIKEIEQLLKDYDIEVDSPDGWVQVTNYIKKGKKKAYSLNINNNEILSSKYHLYETNDGWIFANELNDKKHLILCEDGQYKSFTISKTNQIINVVDISVNHKNHRYYTNGVSSHNTNMGKSLIKASLAANCILANKNVLYVTCEMSEDKISERLMANLFDISLEDLKLIPKNKLHDHFERIKKLIQKKIVIKEYPPKAINVNHIRNLVKELSVRKKFTPDIIFIDYIGIMNAIYNNKNDNTYLEVKRISEEVRALAVELCIPIVSSIQTNRNGFDNAELSLVNVADSIGTAATADIIIGIMQSVAFRELGQYRWIILKNRYGINQIAIDVGVDYYKMRVYDLIGATTVSTSINPPNEKVQNQIVQDTITDVKNILSKDTNDKFKKMISFE